MNNIEKALQTWYPDDNQKHLELLHPALALAGETGELLDLLKKHLFKPGVNWDDAGKYDIPMIEDELGDWTYYDRIIEYIQNEQSFKKIDLPENMAEVITELVTLNYIVALFVYRLIVKNHFDENSRISMQYLFSQILQYTGKGYQDIVNKNFIKLNPKDGSKHGWKGAE